MGLQQGDEVYVRGPYGVPVRGEDFSKIILVSGGCGLAALYQMARDFHNTELLLGVKTHKDLFYLEKAQQCADVHIATEDGSVGYKGLVTELLRKHLQECHNKGSVFFFNCGPEEMIDAAFAIEQQYTSPEKIYSAIDYVTKCGVGLCGSCATKDGRRLCVDGPFMSVEDI
jgi:dihydroorotate dehydrogenase (NAD+) catalytic subunit